eukprot:9057615-Pyramimonas_sp.AAC.1
MSGTCWRRCSRRPPPAASSTWRELTASALWRPGLCRRQLFLLGAKCPQPCPACSLPRQSSGLEP